MHKVVAKEIRDPVITAQLSNGFVVKSILEGYLPNDQGSQGFDRRTDLYEVKWNGKRPRARGVSATRKRSAKIASVHEK